MDRPVAWAKIGESSDARPQRETRSIVVRKLIRVGAAATAAAVFVVALGGVAAAKTVSDKKYAKTLCKEFRGIQDANTTLADGFNAAIEEYNASQALDPTAFHTKLSGTVDAFIASVENAQTKLKKLSPDDGGKAITRTFNAYFEEQLAKLTEAIDRFRSADPNGVAYQADVTVLQTALNLVDIGASDPFRDVQDRTDLAQAFDDEKLCAGVVDVTIIGG